MTLTTWDGTGDFGANRKKRHTYVHFSSPRGAPPRLGEHPAFEEEQDSPRPGTTVPVRKACGAASLFSFACYLKERKGVVVGSIVTKLSPLCIPFQEKQVGTYVIRAHIKGGAFGGRGRCCQGRQSPGGQGGVVCGGDDDQGVAREGRGVGVGVRMRATPLGIKGSVFGRPGSSR